jgi:LuxR family transcriptional regulator, regulator of acetate metabolism
VNDEEDVHKLISTVLPERLQRLQRVTGVPVVFGGTTRTSSTGRELVLSRLIGCLSESLRGLAVHPGRGLGGAVLQRGVACRVNDYASTSFITHDFDSIVVGQERLTSMFAVPVVTRGVVHCVLYGAVRHQHLIGDRAVRDGSVIAAQLERELRDLPTASTRTASTRTQNAPLSTPAALAELAEIIRTVRDSGLRERLARVHRSLGGEVELPSTSIAALAPRELDVLRLVAVGSSNVEIAAQLGLSPQTVKAYLRSSMRKLGVHNRTAASHRARRAGVL